MDINTFLLFTADYAGDIDIGWDSEEESFTFEILTDEGVDFIADLYEEGYFEVN